MRIEQLGGHLLLKIYNQYHEFRTLATLSNPKADRNERVGCVKTLKYYGYIEAEAIEIILKWNKWEDFNKETTIESVHKVYMERERISGYNAPCSAPRTDFKTRRTPIFSKSEITQDNLIFEFWKHAEPIPKMEVPKNPNDAAWFYHLKGYHALPKAPKGCNCHICRERPQEKKGKHPDTKQVHSWKDYQFRQPTSKEMEQWDFSNGICLIATDGDIFCDLDQPYGGKIETHAETTPRGGLHLFGKGSCKPANIEGIGEIKGIGSLIVAAPTPGYEVLQGVV